MPITKVASQYPGLYIFSTPARMMRPVFNLAANKVEMIGTFEQVCFLSNVNPLTPRIFFFFYFFLLYLSHSF